MPTHHVRVILCTSDVFQIRVLLDDGLVLEPLVNIYLSKSSFTFLYLSSASFPLFQLEILLKYFVSRAIPSLP